MVKTAATEHELQELEEPRSQQWLVPQGQLAKMPLNFCDHGTWALLDWIITEMVRAT